MSVHVEISKHSQKQQAALKKFADLDQKREMFIEEAVQKCRNNEEFSVDSINSITKEINDLAKNEIVPTRKYISAEMVKEYVKTL